MNQLPLKHTKKLSIGGRYHSFEYLTGWTYHVNDIIRLSPINA